MVPTTQSGPSAAGLNPLLDWLLYVYVCVCVYVIFLIGSHRILLNAVAKNTEDTCRSSSAIFDCSSLVHSVFHVVANHHPGVALLLVFHYLRLEYLDLLLRTIPGAGLDKPHPLHGPQTGLDPAEYGMFPIEPRRRRQRDEELRSVGIRPRVGHAEDPRARVLQRRRDLVLEFVAVDGRTSPTGARRVAALHHEVRDDAVEDGAVVVAAGGELGEVLAGLGGVGCVELDGDGALFFAGQLVATVIMRKGEHLDLLLRSEEPPLSSWSQLVCRETW